MAHEHYSARYFMAISWAMKTIINFSEKIHALKNAVLGF